MIAVSLARAQGSIRLGCTSYVGVGVTHRLYQDESYVDDIPQNTSNIRIPTEWRRKEGKRRTEESPIAIKTDAGASHRCSKGLSEVSYTGTCTSTAKSTCPAEPERLPGWGLEGEILSSTACGNLSTIALCAAKLCGVSIVWVLAALGPGGDICECPWTDRRICDGARGGLRRGKDLVSRSSTNVERWEEEAFFIAMPSLCGVISNQDGQPIAGSPPAKDFLETRCR
ncbi:hypothetical protein BDV23DRAFT_152904 [Aspergillus alliaceus]|uniref:Uncharacterized protein n=1 Tax=Petromyces alliaceus TaxID=209559 RepID=A0A5N7CBN5_PETAA|nr:hypothetical protein BDV23DRAFT_152904 [Aspergillus alliaceus]